MPDATSVYVVVALGLTGSDPLAATDAPSIVTVVAFCVVHVRVLPVPPTTTLVGVAVNEAVGGKSTLTVAAACAGVVPLAPVATNVYVVVCVGVTVCDPFGLTAAPFNVTDVAFCVVHVNVAGCPCSTVGALAFRFATGSGGPVTVIVLAACAGVVPLGPVATRVYVVVELGFTCIEPDASTAFPFSVTEVAFCVVQVRVAAWPGWILVTLDVRDAEGAGAGTALNPPHPEREAKIQTAKIVSNGPRYRVSMARGTSTR